MPVVLTDSYISDLGNMVNIGLADFEGARLATQHLIENGHKRVVFASPAIKVGGVVEQRLLGYKSALEANGLPFDPSLVYECEFSTTKMMEQGAQLANRDDFTAVFATADLLAAGIMSGLQQAGRMVPRDISIVGFDDINWSRMTMPMLTTVRQEAMKKGRMAAECMLKLLAGEPVDVHNRILPVQTTGTRQAVPVVCWFPPKNRPHICIISQFTSTELFAIIWLNDKPTDCTGSSFSFSCIMYGLT